MGSQNKRYHYPLYLDSGMKFGRLVVIEVDEESKLKNGKKVIPSNWRYWCHCACPAKTVRSISRKQMVDGTTKSCGCLHTEENLRKSEENRKTNPIKVEGATTKIFFFQYPEEFALIDTEDYEKVRDYCWRKHVGKTGNKYVYSSTHQKQGGSVRMHNLILSCEKGFLPDHKNGNGLDNRKSNLRPLTESQNMMNKKVPSNNTSGVMGIHYHKQAEQWVASIGKNKVSINLGMFPVKIDAIKARYIGERIYFGNKARDWELKYADNQEILDLLPWLESEYEKAKETLEVPEKYKHLLDDGE